MEDKRRLLDIVNNFQHREVIVAGDIILDCYEWASHIKDSKEDLCFIGYNPEIDYCPGGAGNVFANIASLTGLPYLCSVTGKDNLGRVLRTELASKLQNGLNNGELDCVFELEGRVTTLKRRTCFQVPDGHGYRQIGRVDFETRKDLDDKTIDEMIVKLRGKKDGVMSFSDYAKGFFNETTALKLKEFAKEQGLIVIVDPKPVVDKPQRMKMFEGCYGFTPNLREAQEISGIFYESPESLAEISRRCIDVLKPEGFLLITHGKEGMHLYHASGEKEEHIPAVNVDVTDITGAGDTVVAVLSLALAADASISEAARLANYAASIVVGKKGTATATREELTDLIERL